MKKKIIFLLPLFVLFLISCKPIAPEVNNEYVGFWEGYGSGYYEISIQPSGQASYQALQGITTVTATGKARVRGDKFKIGLKKFTLNQEPKQDVDGDWTMILDGVTYYRY